MTVETAEVLRTGLDTTNRFAGKMRTDAGAVEAARSAHPALRESMGGLRADAGTERARLAAASAGATTDRATGTSVDLEREVQDVLELSADIENAVAEAAEALQVGNVTNDRIREEIINDIAETMQRVAALRTQQPHGPAAAQDELMRLFQRLQQYNGQSADNAAATIDKLSAIAGRLGGGDQGTSASSAGGATQVAPSFNTGGTGGSGGSGGGGAAGVGGGVVTKPRLPVAIPPQPGTGVEINLPDGSTVRAPNETAAKAVRAALSQLGVPYVWGGTAPGQGLDCSGLTMTSYGEAGLQIPRIAKTQTVGAEVPSIDQLLPGDLVVWSGHVAMVIGNGQMIEAGDPVQINPIRTTNAGQQFIGFYRPTG
ncbi:NlpC/P60 family protein [Amycolatopsis arida]|uniref:NlpC/P60 family protein n=1 Tax=Amycolatopsis arida TaxID=587909 RepID=A0A1I5M873_9PSEU|nr:C40 family peptidase [Amycolatopsis arida]TDX93987.1 NlpC/P60 family protein [Amycolatopsis arida]SFP05116.1 NlpC/P60 family protein [Amycolatopsis arida]